MCDEGTDCSNLEQLSFNIRNVDHDLEVHEDFLGFYEVDNIKSDTIVAAIKDSLLRSNLSLDSCHGQIYDGASNMLGKKSGAVTQLSAIQPKALPTHCFGHSVSLAVKDLTSDCKLLGDTMGAAGEINVLVKFSPKREKMLGDINKNVEGLDQEGLEVRRESLDKLCATHWTVRANCFQKIIDQYDSLQQLWDLCLQEKLTTDVCSRIIGCQAQMQSFNFFFGLCLGQRLYSHINNLSKDLHSKTLPAIAALGLALLTKDTLMSLRSDENFKMFFDVVSRKASLHPQIEQPTLTRKRNRPNYSILTNMEGHLTAENHHPVTVEDYYRPLYFEAINSIVHALMSHFEQPSFKAFCTTEQVFLKGIEDEDASDEIEEMKKIFGDDVDVTLLSTKLEVLRVFVRKINLHTH